MTEERLQLTRKDVMWPLHPAVILGLELFISPILLYLAFGRGSAGDAVWAAVIGAAAGLPWAVVWFRGAAAVNQLWQDKDPQFRSPTPRAVPRSNRVLDLLVAVGFCPLAAVLVFLAGPLASNHLNDFAKVAGALLGYLTLPTLAHLLWWRQLPKS